MQTLKEAVAIYDYPELQPDNTLQAKLARIIKTYAWVFVAIIAIAPLLVLADKLVVNVLHHKSLNNINKQQFQQLYKKLGAPAAALFVCLIGPFFEELIFRLGLKFRKREVWISVLVAVVYFGIAPLRKMMPAGQVWMVTGIGLALIVAGVALCYHFIPNDTFELTDKAKLRFTELSMILFALMHALNYRPMEWSLIWIYPIYVLPQLLMGWGVTYVRMKNGFAWGVALHCLINTVSTVLSLWVKP